MTEHTPPRAPAQPGLYLDAAGLPWQVRDVGGDLVMGAIGGAGYGNVRFFRDKGPFTALVPLSPHALDLLVHALAVYAPQPPQADAERALAVALAVQLATIREAS